MAIWSRILQVLQNRRSLWTLIREMFQESCRKEWTRFESWNRDNLKVGSLLYSPQDLALHPEKFTKNACMRPVILFVLKNSPYKELGFDCYDEERDARSYSGSLPVVAHPPCQLWGKMAVVNYRRWGGEHNRPGNDGGLFKFALDTVNRCGGVLEHPALSMAWKEYGLEKPLKDQWTKSGEGWTCEVWQSAYGHKANKKTWLYYKGAEKPEDPLWDRPKGTHQIGSPDRRGKSRNKPTLGKYEANATPQRFMEYLVRIAANSGTTG